MQRKLFEIEEIKQEKSYGAIRHDIKREKQKSYDDSLHHPDEKIYQLRNILSKKAEDLTIIEFFAGQGNLTKIYAEYGVVIANELNTRVFEKLKINTQEYDLVQCNKVDSFLDFHKLIALKRKFNVVDIDAYGFPNRFFPDVFLLIDDGIIFITMPKPYVNILNGITKTHLTTYYGEHNPSLETIIMSIVQFGLCHWRKLELLDCIDCKSIWRMAFTVKRVKANEYTGSKNR